MAGIVQCNGGKFEEAEVSSFIVCSNQNRSALVRDWLSYNSLFVGWLYKDKSLGAQHARDLISFTTNLQKVKNYSRADLFHNNNYIAFWERNSSYNYFD